MMTEGPVTPLADAPFHRCLSRPTGEVHVDIWFTVIVGGESGQGRDQRPSLGR